MASNILNYELRLFQKKKCLKTSEGQTEDGIQRNTGNIMATEKGTKGQSIIHKPLIEKYEPNNKRRVKKYLMISSSCSTGGPVVLLLNHTSIFWYDNLV